MPDSEIIISKYKDIPVVTAFIDNRLEYLSFVRDSKLHNIYLGKVDHIVKNIDAAFIRISDEEIGYLPLNRINSVCVINRPFGEGDSLRNGDEVLVQVEAEAIKTKKAKLTTSISLSGKYSVVTLGRNGIGSSVKLEDNIRKEVTELVKPVFLELSKKYVEKLSGASVGAIIRTNVKELQKDALLDSVIFDIEEQIKRLVNVIESASTRTVYSCLFSPVITDESNESGEDTKEFDDLTRSHITKAKAFLRTRDINSPRIIVDTGIHGIPSKIEALCQNKVWLKSGAFLIIEQLESFNAIDVNTGKAIKSKKDASIEVNFEAACEIMRQIRLRNLTGMILIDFINMKDKESYDRLIEYVSSLCRLDPVHTSFIDITGLGIMELTRNKNDKSLKELLKEINEN